MPACFTTAVWRLRYSCCVGALWTCVTAGSVSVALPIGNFRAAQVNPADEAYLFTPAGFTEPGTLRTAEGDQVAELRVTIHDAQTQKPTPCRVNIVGADGNYYQPEKNDLAPYGFTGTWPDEGARGNRLGKGPIRYFGWFFYTSGRFNVKVPAGAVRIEVWKGFEYRPRIVTTNVDAGDVRQMSVAVERTLPATDYGYYAGDPHIHIPRRNNKEDQLVFDLMEAEGILYGSILCYNEPAGPYAGVMDQQDMPQLQGLGPRSLRTRGHYHILSGQEYRSTLYGHLNLYLREGLVLPGQSVNADNFPIYGKLAEQTRRAGGLAVYAHGGYSLEVYIDAVLEKIDAIELLQFSRYRGIGLDDWYRLLNAGFRIPVTGASDYPACRKLGDCKTYVYRPARPDFEQWYRGMGNGDSFVSSGPVLLLEVDGNRPGALIHVSRDNAAPATARLRVISEVAPVTDVQLIVNGSVVRQLHVPADAGQGHWMELQHAVPLAESCWIAARAFSKSPTGSPDAEAHTNPVYVYVNGRAPYDQDSVDRLLKEIERQIAYHQSREFAEKSEVVGYFLKSRDRLQQIRGSGGRAAPGTASATRESERADTHAAAVAGDPEQLARYLTPIPPKSPEEALAAFKTAEGFHMELVAHEPLVVDPIAAAFDENGRLYVAEMRDYPYKPNEGQKPIGRVRLLEDTDGDGRMDRSHVFAEHLLWAGGIAPWRQGVFVASPPDIWYLKDTDGDHRADVRRKIATGFGTQNQQGMLNNLQWGTTRCMVRPRSTAATSGPLTNQTLRSFRWQDTIFVLIRYRSGSKRLPGACSSA